MTNSHVQRQQCDWCGITEDIPWDQRTKVLWARVEAFQLVGGEAASVWEVCPHCWSIIEARRQSFMAEGRQAGRFKEQVQSQEGKAANE